MNAEDRDAHTGIPYSNRDSPGTFAELKMKTEAMAKICYQIFNKQKEYVNEYQALQSKCNKLEADLAQANIWAEKCRNSDLKIIGLQRSISTYHSRLTALEEAAGRVRAIETATADAEDRLNGRIQHIDEHMVLVEETLGVHTNLIRRAAEETLQREEAMTYRSVGRDTELANRLVVSEHWNQHLAFLVHQLYLHQARANGVPEDQHPVLVRTAPEPDHQHGVIVHGYT
eukprot:5267936-Amphidinium_carterae.1